MIILRQKLYRQADIINNYWKKTDTPVIFVNPNTGFFTRGDLPLDEVKKPGILKRIKKAITKKD